MIIKINEKTISIRVSGFKDYCPIDYGRTCTRLAPREIKINLVAYLINSKHNNYININLNEEWANGGTGRRVGLKIQW